MIDYFLENWGSFASALGIIVSAGGVAASLIAVYRAGKARDAASAAQLATQETRAAITRVLTIADLQRAIALIQRLKVLHRDQKWEASLEHYQNLRVMLADIDARLPALPQESRTSLRRSVAQIVVMENIVDEALTSSAEPRQASSFNEELNTIQVNLENLASSSYLGEDEANR